MALLEQSESRGLLIADAHVFRDWIVGSYVDGVVAVDKFALASGRLLAGRRVVTAARPVLRPGRVMTAVNQPAQAR
jgi:hypothetical protein